MKLRPVPGMRLRSVAGGTVVPPMSLPCTVEADEVVAVKGVEGVVHARRESEVLVDANDNQEIEHGVALTFRLSASITPPGAIRV